MNVGTRGNWPVHYEASDSSWEGGNRSPHGTSILLVKKEHTEDRLAWQGVTCEAVLRLLEPE